MYAAFLFDIFNISDNFLTRKFDIYAHLFEMFENDSPSYIMFPLDAFDIDVHFLFDTYTITVVPTNSDSDVIFCLQLLRKTLTCTLHLR